MKTTLNAKELRDRETCIEGLRTFTYRDCSRLYAMDYSLLEERVAALRLQKTQKNTHTEN